MDTNQEYENYKKAQKKVEEIKGFYGHLFSYTLVISILIFINLKYTPSYLWFFWTAFGWGIGLFFHAVRVFNWFPFFNKDWEEKKIQEFMDEDMKNRNKYK